MTWSGRWIRRSMEQASSRGPPGTGRHHVEELVLRSHRARGPDATTVYLPPSYALLLKGERCGVAAPRITAPHYPSTHSHSQAARVRTRRGPRISRPRSGQPGRPDPSLFLSPSLSPRPRLVGTRYRLGTTGKGH